MSQNKVVALELAVDTDGSVSAMSRLTAAFEKSDSAASGLSRAATGLNQTVELGKQAYAAFAAVIAESVRAYAAEEGEINRVRLSLDRVGIGYDTVSEKISNYVDERARITRFEDSQVREQIIALADASATLGASAEDLMEWATLAQDIGEASGNMEEGLALVEAAASGKVAALAKAIPAQRAYLRELAQIPDAATRAEKAIEFLSEQYGGQSEALSGAELAVIDFDKSLADLRESFGEFLMNHAGVKWAIFSITTAMDALAWSAGKVGDAFDTLTAPFRDITEESERAATAQAQLSGEMRTVADEAERQSRAYDTLLTSHMQAMTGGNAARALQDFYDDVNAAFEASLDPSRLTVRWANALENFYAGVPSDQFDFTEKISAAFQEISLRDLVDAQSMILRYTDAAKGAAEVTVDLTAALDGTTTVIDGQTVSWRTAIGVYLEAQQAEMDAANTNREAAQIRRSSTDDQISAMRELAEASAASAAQNIAAGAEEIAALQAHATEQARIVQYKKKLAAEAYNLAVEESLLRQDRLAQEHTAIISTADVYRSISQEIAGSITAAFAPPSDGGKPFRKIVGSMINVIGTLATIASGVYLAMPGMQGFGIALAAAAAVAYSAGAALGAGGGKRQTEAGNVSTVNSNNSSVTNIYIAGSNTGSTGRPVASAESFAMAHRQAKRLGYVAA